MFADKYSYQSVPNCSLANFFEYSPAIQENRVTTVQGLSGTGSLRVGGEFLAKHYHQVKWSILKFFSPLYFFNQYCCISLGLPCLFALIFSAHYILANTYLGQSYKGFQLGRFNCQNISLLCSSNTRAWLSRLETILSSCEMFIPYFRICINIRVSQYASWSILHNIIGFYLMLFPHPCSL